MSAPRFLELYGLCVHAVCVSVCECARACVWAVPLCVGDSTKEEGEDPAGVLASGASATAGTSTSTGTNMAPSTADDMVCLGAVRLTYCPPQEGGARRRC